MKKKLTFILLALSSLLLGACSSSDDVPDTKVVTSLDFTVTGEDVQCPSGNVYLFYSPNVPLSYATNEGDGSQWPLITVSTPDHPMVKYVKNGRETILHPVSRYGTMEGSRLDNHSSVRYSQVHFDIGSLSTEYGKVGENSELLVVIVLDDPLTKSWVGRALQLRRDYLIHIYLPDSKNQSYVGNNLSIKWWQVEGDE